jgi:hypothetical protein
MQQKMRLEVGSKAEPESQSTTTVGERREGRAEERGIRRKLEADSEAWQEDRSPATVGDGLESNASGCNIR